MAKIADILDKAADLIEPEGAWGKYEFARDSGGFEIAPQSIRAVCFCARGAVYHVLDKHPIGVPEEENRRIFAPLVSVLGVENFDDIETWNDADERTQSEVVAKLREAAQQAREQGL